MIIYKGTSIIEIVISAALISISVIAVLSLMNHSQKQVVYSRNLTEATKYAQEAADWIRSQRTSLGFATLATIADGSYCLNSFPSSFTALVPGECGTSMLTNNDLFQRQFSLTMDGGGDKITFIISVTWQEKVERQASIEMELSKW